MGKSSESHGTRSRKKIERRKNKDQPIDLNTSDKPETATKQGQKKMHPTAPGNRNSAVPTERKNLFNYVPEDMIKAMEAVKKGMPRWKQRRNSASHVQR